MQSKLTDRQKQRYLRDAGLKCPHCRSIHLNPGDLEVDGDNAWSRVTCLDCEREWTDHYTLTGVSEKGG